MRLALLALASSTLVAQTIPTTPVVTGSTPTQGQVSVTVNLPNCQWGNTSCGLSDCGCWEQLWRAQCSSATTCPTQAKGSPFTQLANPTITNNGADAGNGTSGMVIQDTDAALISGTFWSYFVTANFAKDPNYTVGAPSNAAVVTIPGSAPVVKFSVKLAYDNSACVTSKPCNAEVWRVSCSNVNTCPAFSTTLYTKLAATTTQTVTSTNTHFVSVDTNSGLAYNSFYSYAIRNAFTATPSTLGTAQQVVVTTPTGIHTAIINWSNSLCTTLSPCTLQVYRALCSSSTSCPTYSPGSSSFKALNMTIGLVPTVGTQGSSWVYTDKDAAIVGNTTYVWVATNAYSSGNSISPASKAFVGTTGVGRTVVEINLSKKETQK